MPTHPRSRGENLQPAIDAIKGAGSSPLTRGKQASVFLGIAWSGLIPAHAGKTSARVEGMGPNRAHPHSRGENDGGFNWRANFPGSSPLTRGKPEHITGHGLSSGLIPAHAGKT